MLGKTLTVYGKTYFYKSVSSFFQKYINISAYLVLIKRALRPDESAFELLNIKTC